MRQFLKYITEKMYEGAIRLGAPDNDIQYLTISRHDFTNEFNMDATDTSDETILKILKEAENTFLQLDDFLVYSPGGEVYEIKADDALKLYTRQSSIEEVFGDNWEKIETNWPTEKYRIVDELISDIEDTVYKELEYSARENGIKYWDE